MYRKFLLLILLLSFPVKAELPFKFALGFQTYPIYVNDNDSFYSSYNNRPLQLKKLNLAAATIWNYTVDIDKKTCEINQFDVSVDYITPVFLDSHNRPALDYLEKTTQIHEHEERHCSIVIKHLDAIHSLFSKPTNKTCEEKLIASEVLKDQIDEDNALFDVYTSNGEIELAESPFEDDDYIVYCKITDPTNIHKY